MLEFKKISLDMKDRAEAALKRSQFRACDYTFANNYAWRRLNKSKAAFYKDFYIVFFEKTKSGNPEFVYPAGGEDIEDVTSKLFEYSKAHGFKLIYNNVSEKNLELLQNIYKNKIIIEYSDDDSDYIYLRDSLANLKGKKYHGKRNHIAKFEREHEVEYRVLTPDLFDDAIVLSTRMYNHKSGYKEEEARDEQFAINSLLHHFESFGLSGGAVFADENMAAFCIGEPLTDDTFVVHIEKAAPEYEEGYAVINNCFSKSIPKKYTYINREEDMGIEGLRRAKKSYIPEFLQKKYKVIFEKI